jgi:hypothetical protein
MLLQEVESQKIRCSRKENQRRIKYYRLGRVGEIEENNGRDNLIVVEITSY